MVPALIYPETALLREICSGRLRAQAIPIRCSLCGSWEIITINQPAITYSGSMKHLLECINAITFCSHCVPFSVQTEGHRACLDFLGICVAERGD